MPDDWYLDGGKFPTCIAVEAGQADLFLSGYLGIDFVTKGLAVYRLLDAVVSFHRGLPGPGEVIRYDIAISGSSGRGTRILFRFHFEATVDGEPLLTMRDGCAGFFTAEELAAGQGVVRRPLDLRPIAGMKPDDWSPLAPMAVESYDRPRRSTPSAVATSPRVRPGVRGSPPGRAAPPARRTDDAGRTAFPISTPPAAGSGSA